MTACVRSVTFRRVRIIVTWDFTVAYTDFSAKLVDVWPDGHAQDLTEGILRASHRDSFQRTEPLTPGTLYPFALDLWSTSNVFLKGHRIRVEISSSNFPRFDRNLNINRNVEDGSASSNQAVRATNVVYHDADHPSAQRAGAAVRF